MAACNITWLCSLFTSQEDLDGKQIQSALNVPQALMGPCFTKLQTKFNQELPTALQQNMKLQVHPAAKALPQNSGKMVANSLSCYHMLLFLGWLVRMM